MKHETRTKNKLVGHFAELIDKIFFSIFTYHYFLLFSEGEGVVG
jgi:hypothetical protein